ncbi:hypothetical protein F383_29260 [Gossypium arboreum]|uniref:Uncharacterized protein n=1 Tax=Gossypium arboreum TaxID=29729 RepID=A0A0B0PEX1_GOSAR|nr:hypothetical protein F383_29260 [Gossypium arboreum]
MDQWTSEASITLSIEALGIVRSIYFDYGMYRTLTLEFCVIVSWPNVLAFFSILIHFV